MPAVSRVRACSNGMGTQQVEPQRLLEMLYGEILVARSGGE